MPEKIKFNIQQIWLDLPTYKRQNLLETLDISRSTFYLWRNDPGAMRFDQVIKLCNFLEIENPREIIKPAL